MPAAARKFEDKPAVRQKTPLLLGLIGPSGTGKTFSALRLATGIQSVMKGEIFFIDSEARRALHYADRFKFRHVEFAPPFGPLDYLDAIEHCVGKGATTVIVDSMSHEHEGPGGVLEMHAAEVERMSGGDPRKAERVKLGAWNKPKVDRRRMINRILQMQCNFLFCFRAKDKLKITTGQDPRQMGFMPIAGEEFVYEMVAKFLLLPGANGVPTWHSDYEGERMMMKIPEQFREIFSKPEQLSEDLGRQMALWAAGAPAPLSASSRIDDLLAAYADCGDSVFFSRLEQDRKDIWPKITAPEKERLKAAADAVQARLNGSPA